MEIKTVGVVGCGTMGSGIAQVCAQSGYQVVVSEISDELLNKGLASINSFLTRNVKKGRLTEEEKDATLARIKGTIDLKDFSDCDLVIEAAIENMDIKKKVFTELDKICPNGHCHYQAGKSAGGAFLQSGATYETTGVSQDYCYQ